MERACPWYRLCRKKPCIAKAPTSADSESLNDNFTKRVFPLGIFICITLRLRRLLKLVALRSQSCLELFTLHPHGNYKRQARYHQSEYGCHRRGPKSCPCKSRIDCCIAC